MGGRAKEREREEGKEITEAGREGNRGRERKCEKYK